MNHILEHRAASTPDRSGLVSRRLRALWNALLAAIGAVVGLAPHVLHHVGLLAGAGLVAGTGGTLLFGSLGLVASIPVLMRLRRRFNSWWAPIIGLAVFAAMFAISAFLVGPAFSGNTDSGSDGGQPSPTVDHDIHHETLRLSAMPARR